MNEINVDVQGFPPAKNEAKSLFAKNHKYADRVITLLRQVKQEIDHSTWCRNKKRRLELKLLLSDTVLGSPPLDATNILGGIADVLQADRACNTGSSHLDDMKTESPYKNDHQIKEIQYPVKCADEPYYRIRVWVLTEEG